MKTTATKTGLLTALCVACALLILHGSLMPFDLQADWGAARDRLGRAWGFWPFGQLHTSRSDLASNFALYVPLGLLVAARGAVRRGGKRRGALMWAVLTSLATSLIVECLQLFSPSRIAGAHDLLLNIAGGLTGGLAGAAVGRRAWVRLRRALRLRRARGPMALLGLALLVLLAAEALFPFRPTLDVSHVVSNLRASHARLREAFAAETWYYWVFWRAGVYAVLANLLAVSFATTGRPRWRRGTAVAIGFAAVAELAKLFIVSRSANVANVLVSAFGALAGGLAAAAVAGHRRRRESPAAAPEIGPRGGRPEAAHGPAAHPGRTCLILTAVYAALVVYGSLVPLRFRYVPLEDALRTFRDIPYLRLGIRSRADLMANLVLFVPLTFLAMGAFTRENRRRARPLIAVAVLAAAALLSAAVEFAQIYFAPRTVSQNDVLAETAGGAAGVLLWLCCGGRVAQWARDLWRERARDRLAVKILCGYAVVLILYQLFPFDFTISLKELSARLSTSRVAAIRLGEGGGLTAYAAGSKTAVMIPIGFLLSLLGPGGRRRQVWRVTLQAFVFAGAIEAAQLFIWSRCSSVADVVLGTAGGCLGGVAAALFGPAARRGVLDTPFWGRYGTPVTLAATVAWTGGLTWQKWRPFDFALPRQGLAAAAGEVLAVPFARQYALPELLALGQVVRESVTFFILGMLVGRALAPLGRAGRAGGALLVALLAVALEFGQVFCPTRTADLTAMAISGAAGVLGVVLSEGFVKVFLAPARAPE